MVLYKVWAGRILLQGAYNLRRKQTQKAAEVRGGNGDKANEGRCNYFLSLNTKGSGRLWGGIWRKLVKLHRGEEDAGPHMTRHTI